MLNYENYHCRICGLRQSEPPWGNDGKTASFNICPCCGAEFGYHDATLQAIQRYRENWLLEGAKWFEPHRKPEQWSLEKQFKEIPQTFL